MNIIKKIAGIALVALFTLVLNTPANAKIDCDNPKGFHENLVCKIKSKDMKEKLKKLKNLGGKNLGEEG